MPTSAYQGLLRPATVAALALASLALAAPVQAQFDTGQLSGVVRDAQGGVVPGASVRIIHEQTRLERNIVTDASGYFVVPALPLGLYQVEVELPGFRKVVKRGITLDATSKVAVDAVLVPGGIEEALTVEAGATPLQFDTGQISKTIEAKQIQELMLNGRNPFVLALLKPGVRGLNFGQFSPDSPFLAQNIYINGARSDENQITYDGVTAVRTRSSVAAIGVPNVDALQEVQVLTASYLPEYGRSSGGQIRFVTRSGGRDFHGDGYGFFRDEALDANTWGRNNSPLPEQNSQPAPYSYKQFGYDVGGPLYVPGKLNANKDKLFFFWAQEWIRWSQPSTLTGTVPTARMRSGDFGELLDPGNPFYGRSVVIRDPVTGLPFPGNVIPRDRLSPNGLALLGAYPLPTPGFQRGTNNWTDDSDFPRRIRKDTLRLDFMPQVADRLSFRFSHYDWKYVSASQGTFPLVRTDWNAPNDSAALTWTRTLSSSMINEATAGFSQDRVYLNTFQGTDSFRRSRYGINYPYIFPGTKELEDKIPTVAVGGLSTIDGSPYPAFSKGPIWTFSDNLTWLMGRHTLKAGVSFEYSGEDDFDQINVAGQPGDTNNQNGRFEFTDGRTAGTGNAIANAAMGLFTNYGEIGRKSLTKWRSLAVDAFLQDSWKARDNLTLEYGVRYVYWPPWYAKCNNIASFDPRYYDPGRAAVIDPRTGAVLSGDRFNGIVLPGDGFPGDCAGEVAAAGNPDYQRLFHGLPRGLSETHSTVFQPRFGLAWSINPRTVLRVGGGVFHTRVTLNDSTLLGGNPPVQLKVGVTNGNVDQPIGATRQDFPLVMTAQDPVFNHPTAYNWSVSFQRQLPWDVAADVTYVGRVGTHLPRERNINQLLPGTIQANPGVNPNALRPYKGFGVIRLSENAGRSKYNGLQLNLERRFRGGLGFGVAYTLSRSADNADGKRDLLYNAYDDSSYWGPSGYDRTHVLNVHYIYELPFWRQQDTFLKKALGGWQISGVNYYQSGAPFWIGTSNDRAGVGDTIRQPWDLVGDPNVSKPGFSTGPGKDDIFWFNGQAFRQPAAGTFGNMARNSLRGPSTWGWDLSLIKNIQLNARDQRLQLRVEAFNVLNHPNLAQPGDGGFNNDPLSGSFGRVTSKAGNRAVQLGVKFIF
jgi:hypothetical protein